jgi:arylsulfatase A-like enzyme
VTLLRVVLSLAVLAPLLAGCGRPYRAPSLILLVVDTLRADALGCYGSPDADTPVLDALAARGVLFRRCVSQAPWTLPAVGTVLTGRYPSGHGANRLLRPAAPGATLLPEMLRPSGYDTGAVVSNHFLEPKYGLHRGFDHYDDSPVGDASAVTSEAVTDAALRWIREDQPQPFFLFLFYMDPHYRYMAHEGWTRGDDYSGPVRSDADIWELRARCAEMTPADRARLRELYLGEVRALDHAVGRLVAALDEDGRLDNTFFLITADHGEELGERGWIGHTRNLHGDLLDVPLVVTASRYLEPAIRTDPAMLADVFPTVLQLLGQARPHRVVGRALFDPDRPDRPLYAEVTYDPQAIPPQADPEKDARRALELTKVTDMRAVQHGRWKAIRNRLTDTWELYDLEADPGETRDVAAGHADVLERLRAELPEPGTFAVPEGETTAGITPEEIERLRGLGYVR